MATFNLKGCIKREHMDHTKNKAYNETINRAIDCLLYRRFDECLDICLESVKEWRNFTENENVAQAMETIVAVAVQAYAELSRWQEVLPFVTQVYNGIEDCPPLIAQLCLLLHARLKDYVTCTVIAGIWLKNPANGQRPEYRSLAEQYIQRVLLPSSKWEDIEPFLNSCPVFSSSLRQSVMYKIKLLKQKEEILAADEIQVLETDDTTARESALSKKQSAWLNTFDFTDIAKLSFDYKNFAKTVVKYFPSSLLYVMRNLCIATVLFYFLIGRWHSGKLLPVFLRLWMMLVRFGKGMFAPFYEMNK